MRTATQDKKYHTLYFDPARCKGSLACLRKCPVEAIRLRDGKAEMLAEKCIDCGVCIKACKNSAIVPRTNSFQDFSRFKYTVAVPSLALYSQFDRNIKPGTILTALKKIGFDEVLDLTRASVSVFKAIEKYIKDYSGKKPLISTFCPTCVKLIQIRFPELLGNLIPVIPPMELAVRNIKKEIASRINVSEKDIGLIYITPCPSKMMMISQKQGEFYSSYDGAIAISDIYNILYSQINNVVKTSDDSYGHFDISGFGLNFGGYGGLSAILESNNHLNISGLENLIYILDEMEQGRLKDVDYIEINSCHEGCIGGSMTVDNVYVARNKMMNLVRYYGEKKLPVSRKDPYENCEMFSLSIYEPMPASPIDTDLNRAISKINERKEIYSKLPKIDCCACGAPSCMTFAEDVVKGDAVLDECIFIFNEKVKQKLKEKILANLELQRKLEGG